MASFHLFVTTGEYIWERWTIWLFLEHFAALMNDIFISSVNVQSVNLAIIGGTLLYWEKRDWFSFGQWAVSILDSISSGVLREITLCISFARILLVASQDSLSDSCLIFRKVRVLLKLWFVVSSRSSWRIFKWFSRSTFLLFNESMWKVCDVTISVFPEIRDELVSPSLLVWMADFLTTLIEFFMLSYWEDILFSTNVVCCFRFTNFSSIRVLSFLIGLTWVLVALWVGNLCLILAFLKFFV